MRFGEDRIDYRGTQRLKSDSMRHTKRVSHGRLSGAHLDKGRT